MSFDETLTQAPKSHSASSAAPRLLVFAIGTVACVVVDITLPDYAAVIAAESLLSMWRLWRLGMLLARLPTGTTMHNALQYFATAASQALSGVKRRRLSDNFARKRLCPARIEEEGPNQ
mmetsp:Transcript_129426/g.307085  ORF Transcript_129426/g.307085 Transcript_129426/m.307085 type:complete len:119 (-) Transcript_129426:47-403(-)